jgi:hypothetical protein
VHAFPTAQAEGRQTPAGAVASEQRLPLAGPVVAATEEGARTLGRVYWEEVERFTRGLVRTRSGPAGVELRLLGRAPLLRFGPAEVRLAGDVVVCRYAILGGLLARAPGGSISFSQQGGGSPELRSAITGFFPRLGARPGHPDWTGALYAHVQARVHRAVGRRYFARLLREVG